MESIICPLLLLLVSALCSGLPEPLNRCNARIIGGYKGDISQIPFQVALVYNRGHRCGGSLISNRWVLTAAHCVTALGAIGKLKVRINSTVGLAFGRVVGVEGLLIHPKYNELTTDFDFALLELTEEVELSEEFYAAELPEEDELVEDGTCLQVSGWGQADDGEGSEDLLVLDVPAVNWDECSRTFRKIGHLSEQMICAGDYRSTACHGDSGGPLVDGRKLVGVVSWGYPSVCIGYPGVYARVSAVRSWIRFVSEV